MNASSARPLSAAGHGSARPAHGRPLRDADHGRSSRARPHAKAFVRYRQGRPLHDTEEAVRRRKPVDGGHVRAAVRFRLRGNVRGPLLQRNSNVFEGSRHHCGHVGGGLT